MATRYGSPRPRGGASRTGAGSRGIGLPASDLAVGITAAIGTAIVVVLLVIGAMAIFEVQSRSRAFDIRILDNGIPVVDVAIDDVISSLPDGREARGKFTLRMREDTIPAGLIDVARVTPTPEMVVSGSSNNTPRPPSPSSPEAQARQGVNSAMSQLRYEDIVGEEGKERLRERVLGAVNAAIPGSPVVRVYVREYIVK